MTEFEDDAPTDSASDCMYERHAVGLRAYLIKSLRDPELAEDVLQQTFRKYEEERRKRSVAGGIQSAEEQSRQSSLNNGLSVGWLYRVAQNEVAQRKRSETRWNNHRQRLGLFVSQMQRASHDELVAAEQAQLVRAALKQLPAALRDVVELRVLEDLKFAEIAEHLDIPLGTVLSRMNRALAALKRALRGIDLDS